MIDLGKLKTRSFSDALEFGLNVRSRENHTVATLVPIGEWALNDAHLVASFASWRKKFMRYFLTQFEASTESTIRYLKMYSIDQSNRILFAIYVDHNLMGHIGLSNIHRNECELDNILRGRSGGQSDLMHLTENTILKWAFDVLGLDSVKAQVLSNNFLALSLHERCGFQLKERFHLKKVHHDGSITFVRCDQSEATETFYLDIIEITKSMFNR